MFANADGPLAAGQLDLVFYELPADVVDPDPSAELGPARCASREFLGLETALLARAPAGFAGEEPADRDVVDYLGRTAWLA